MENWRALDNWQIGLAGIVPGPVWLLTDLVEQDGIGIPLISDPGYQWHDWLGLGRFSLAQFFNPLVLAKYILGMSKGRRIARAGENADLLRQGGELIVSRNGKVLWGYKSNNPTDRPSREMLSKAVQTI